MKLNYVFASALSLLFAIAASVLPGYAAQLEVGPQAGWQWPSGAPAQVSRAFDPPALRWLPGHRGVDLALTPGTTIIAPAAGQVVYAGNLAGRPVISVRHATGLRLTFEPVEPIVSVGDSVSAGQPLGQLVAGHAGNTLHWGAKYSDDYYIDPLTLVLGQVRLKPWD